MDSSISNDSAFRDSGRKFEVYQGFQFSIPAKPFVAPVQIGGHARLAVLDPNTKQVCQVWVLVVNCVGRHSFEGVGETHPFKDLEIPFTTSLVQDFLE